MSAWVCQTAVTNILTLAVINVKIIFNKANVVTTCMGERRGAYRALVGKPEGRRRLEDPGVDGKIILKWTCERDGGHGLDQSGSG
jgi:hypothetical protein